MKTALKGSEMTKEKSPNLNQGKLVASVKTKKTKKPHAMQSGSRDLDIGKPKVRCIQQHFPQVDLTGRTDPKLAGLSVFSFIA